ncbi:uncharacterized protein LOC118185010 isoform X2 [Stegodyphus dumicola]|uniref:uncharacterized protein LOC118185010 isoform X2 n=1 Tax=Stegodyphus dumicola TaxID=202533 RepID=UPI0015B15BAC|nr:uncharacterized protein LOC118185010 isoform X2 [Stegodyphus dumicola]
MTLMRDSRPFYPNCIKVYISAFLDAFQCLHRKSIEYNGMSLESVAELESGNQALGARLALNIEGIFQDLCNEESNFRKDYIQVQSCVKQYFQIALIPGQKMEECQSKAAFNAVTVLDYDMSEAYFVTKDCLENAYSFGCILVDLQNTCSEAARELTMEVVSRLMNELPDECSNLITTEIKNTFLASLLLEDEQRRIYSSALEIFLTK